MDHDTLRCLGNMLNDIRGRYDSARTIVKDMRDRDARSTEAAYWLGVAQSFSKQTADDLEALHDAIDRLAIATDPKRQ